MHRCSCCHWALIGLSKVYFFGIPEDYLLACSIVPALYLFFQIHPRQRRAAHETLAAAGAQRAARGDVPDHRVLFAFTLLHQLNLFTDC